VTRVVLVPGVLALLPEYASIDDPVADLRAACLDAVSWLGRDVEVVADAQGRRVAEHLLDRTDRVDGEPSYLVVGNGSARRGEKAPGHLDERSFGFDAALGAALASSHAEWPSLDLGEGLLASLDGIRRLHDLLPPDYRATVDYDDDPVGVQYWVMRWSW
jgi:hypothetical protein